MRIFVDTEEPGGQRARLRETSDVLAGSVER